MYDGPFNPNGQQTFQIGNTTPVRVAAAQSEGQLITSYRIVNILTTQQRLSWSPDIAGSPSQNPGSNLTAATPGAGGRLNTITLPGGAVTFLRLPPQCWMIADASAAFEVTPGEGRGP